MPHISRRLVPLILAVATVAGGVLGGAMLRAAHPTDTADHGAAGHAPAPAAAHAPAAASPAPAASHAPAATHAPAAGRGGAGAPSVAAAHEPTPAPLAPQVATPPAAHPAAAHAAPAPKVGVPESMLRLIEGNARFVSGKSNHPNQGPDKRSLLASGQAPFAVILGCADSRTSPEILFDQGLGDLFVTRGAGNVVDDHTIGSIEYAVEHLHSGIIVVLGHERCGAVNAAREIVAAKGHAPGHIDSIVRSIAPAVESTMGQNADATCRANIRNTVLALQRSDPILKKMVEGGQLKVVGAYYDLDTGVVTFMPE